MDIELPCILAPLGYLVPGTSNKYIKNVIGHILDDSQFRLDPHAPPQTGGVLVLLFNTPLDVVIYGCPYDRLIMDVPMTV